jgi:hypothetical protein
MFRRVLVRARLTQKENTHFLSRRKVIELFYIYINKHPNQLMLTEVEATRG